MNNIEKSIKNIEEKVRVIVKELQIQEKEYKTWNGCCLCCIGIVTLPTIFLPIFFFNGLFTLMPNEAAVITLFGKYKGTVREAGYHWINPFCKVTIITLRQQNHDGALLKVNDKRGSPIEIDIVVVWRIVNPVAAIFQVLDYQKYIKMQCDGALRHLAASFSYDYSGEENEVTLLNGGSVINDFLVNELNDRLQFAGIICDEARVTHLMYAKEIAMAMLKRQQADALVGAKQKIVNGVTSIVKDTIKELQDTIKFTEDAKSKLAGNMLVVLCSENPTQPLMHLNQASSKE